MAPAAVYSWFEDAWSTLALTSQEQFPHGLIFSGMVGIGKTDFVEQIIASLLCLQNLPDGSACGECRACVLAATGANADFKRITVETGKTQLGVEQIRASIRWINTSHQFTAKKILYIPQADMMTIQAANSLLKTLEEPPSETVIILTVEHVQSLLATIRSRCRIIRLNKPKRKIALEWLHGQKLQQLEEAQNAPDLELLLDLCSGAPIKVKRLIDKQELATRQLILDEIISIFSDAVDPLVVAKNLAKIDMSQIIFWFYSICMDLIRLKNHLNAEFIMNKDYLEVLQRQYERLNLLQLDRLYAQLNGYYQQKSSQLNQQLLLESLLIRWSNCAGVL